jgi:hypothetical protein
MEIVLLVAIIAVAGSGLYVAATFNKRTKQNTAPLVEAATEDVSKQIEESGKILRQELHRIAEQLQQERNQIMQEINGIHERLDYTDRRILNITGQFSAVLDAINSTGTQIGTWQEQFSRDLYRRLDHHVAQLGGSLAELRAQMDGIERDAKSRETQAIANIKRIEGVFQGIGTRQSKANDELASIAYKLDRQAEINSQGEDNDRWTAEQVIGTVRQIETILSGQSVIEKYLQTSLDYEVVRTTHDDKRRLVTASLRLTSPGADLLWPLLLSFCETVMLKPVVGPEWPRLADSRSYLLWHSSGGPQLEEVLYAKLVACASGPASPDPGLEELRGLVLSLHGAGPGTVQLGPMIINRTPGALLGCVTTAATVPERGNGDTLSPTDPDAWEAALRGLAPGRVIDLTSWADGFL